MGTCLPAKRTRPRSRNNRTTTGFQLAEARWTVLEPLLPVPVKTPRWGGGRPRVADRLCADAICSVLRPGGQWRALNQTTRCAKSTAHDRFQEGLAAGVFLRFLQTGVEQFEERHGLDWDGLSLDGAMTKVPLGGENNRP